MRHALALILALSLCTPALAENPEPVFDNYESMRATLDRHMMRREMADVLRAFGGADEMSEQELAGLEKRVRGLFPSDFEHVDVLRVDQMGGGWRQELYAYWSGLNYIFAYVLLHEQSDRLVALHFKFNTDFAELNQNF